MAVFALSATAHADSITTFDVSNAAGTVPTAVNALGRIAGYYLDANRFAHGFVRSSRGSVSVFDAPGPFAESGQDTIPTAINLAGRVTGYARVPSSESLLTHGFVRQPSGAIELFDAAPDAMRTEPGAINAEGWVAGTYQDTSYEFHGFLRWNDGSISLFELPHFGKVTALTVSGDVIGTCMPEGTGMQRGFVRGLDGTTTLFDAPDVSTQSGGVGCGKCGGTLVTGGNSVGRSVGYYGGADRGHHGFVRAPDGSLSTFDVPGAAGTYPYAVNLLGQIAGLYRDDAGVWQAFLREVTGTVHSFAIAGANGIVISDIDMAGDVIGYYTDANYNMHAFVRRP